ncbi:hypothetical protein B0H10DRAFT_2211004 [Mycena sp. CBHHK59/15]|nr:hypothetical protein B0H10DRAFT_2211004 [Mycena sp. CBHHK59/15]
MSYHIIPSGPVLDPESTEPLPVGNYGWYRNRECTNTRLPDLAKVPFVVASNVLTLHKDMKLHFHSNNFAVDVDDNYRIIVLREIGDGQRLLPTHLPRHSGHDAGVDLFLRHHLRYSLNLMRLGGDIRTNYSAHRILDMMEELGRL